MPRPIRIFRDHGQTQTHDGKHEYLVHPGKFEVRNETSVDFHNDTAHPVTVTLPKQRPVDIPANGFVPVSLPPAPAGEHEYTVDVHATPPDIAHGDHSNPRIVYP